PFAGGVIRTPPLFLDAGAARLETHARADLNSGAVSLDGQLRYEAGDQAVIGSEPVVDIAVEGAIGNVMRRFDTAPLAQFLTQRALEREQARVEKMQAELLEKQRLRREVRYYTQKAELRRVREAEAEARQKAEEEARRKAEEDARRQAEEAARLKAAEEARRQAEDEARLKADEEARRQAEEEARRKAEDAAQRNAAEAARRKAEDDAARIRAEDEARRRAEEEARLRAEQAARDKAREAESQAGQAASADTITREPLPPPARPQRPRPGAASELDFDAMDIEEFLKSHSPGR
ncbi:MAG: AsmA protein, partial [Nitratireductor sp.]